MKTLQRTFAATAIGLLAAGAAFAAPSYRIEVINKANGVAPKTAASISDNGSLAGIGTESQTGENVSFRSRRGKKVEALAETQDMNYPGKPQVNNAGVVVGRYQGDGGNRGGVWAADGTLTDVGSIVGCDDSRGAYPQSINDAGAYVVEIDCPVGGVPTRGGFLVRDGVAVKVPPSNGHVTFPSLINKRGQVAGVTDYLTVTPYVFTWEEGKPVRQLTPTGQEIYLQAMNDRGDVVGMSVTNLAWHPFLHDGKAMRELPTCGQQEVWPVAISNDGWIAGNFYGLGVSKDAALIRDGQCAELQALLDGSGAGWSELSADDMNNAGVIVGHGRFEGYRRVFMATPLGR
ncbi:hypothetical protein AACH06_18335 [Ideonella sp. DXS29W]|uniref:Phosphodiester glycosidase domain-containing protein n=1 Tax=Ideonella lacteola TaxID=2984193 RepID=A0ABU9BS37_9BURK